jgi:hypothetical protein
MFFDHTERCAYQAKVMNTLLSDSRRIVRLICRINVPRQGQFNCLKHATVIR